MTETMDGSLLAPQESGSLRRLFGRLRPRTRGDWLMAAAIAYAALWVSIAIVAPYIVPHDPNEISLRDVYFPMSPDHLLGTDQVGRDIFSRILVGSRTTLIGPLLVVSISGFAGVTLAILSAWRGGWLDTVMVRIFDLLFGLPGILLALVAVTVFGAGIYSAVIALSIVYIPYIARIVRSEALRQRSLPYIAASSITGFSAWTIAWRHLVPNLTPLILSQLILTFGYAMVDLAAISFLGLGVQAPQSDWGVMVSAGQQSILRGHPHEAVFAGIAIVTVVVAFTVIGDKISERYERSA